MTGNKLLKLKPGAIVKVLNEEGFYVLVESEGVRGWVHKNRISIQLNH